MPLTILSVEELKHLANFLPESNSFRDLQKNVKFINSFDFKYEQTKKYIDYIFQMKFVQTTKVTNNDDIGRENFYVDYISFSSLQLDPLLFLLDIYVFVNTLQKARELGFPRDPFGMKNFFILHQDGRNIHNKKVDGEKRPYAYIEKPLNFLSVDQDADVHWRKQYYLHIPGEFSEEFLETFLILPEIQEFFRYFDIKVFRLDIKAIDTKTQFENHMLRRLHNEFTDELLESKTCDYEWVGKKPYLLKNYGTYPGRQKKKDENFLNRNLKSIELTFTKQNEVIQEKTDEEIYIKDSSKNFTTVYGPTTYVEPVSTYDRSVMPRIRLYNKYDSNRTVLELELRTKRNLENFNTLFKKGSICAIKTWIKDYFIQYTKFLPCTELTSGFPFLANAKNNSCIFPLTAKVGSTNSYLHLEPNFPILLFIFSSLQENNFPGEIKFTLTQALASLGWTNNNKTKQKFRKNITNLSKLSATIQITDSQKTKIVSNLISLKHAKKNNSLYRVEINSLVLDNLNFFFGEFSLSNVKQIALDYKKTFQKKQLPKFMYALAFELLHSTTRNIVSNVNIKPKKDNETHQIIEYLLDTFKKENIINEFTILNSSTQSQPTGYEIENIHGGKHKYFLKK